MDQGWEVVEQRGSLWYAVWRDYSPDAYQKMSEWIARGPQRPSRIRSITSNDEPASGLWLEELGEDNTMARGDDAARSGAELGAAIGEVFLVQPAAKQKALYKVAVIFAKLNGYADIDAAEQFVPNFIDALTEPTITTPPKQLGSGG